MCATNRVRINLQIYIFLYTLIAREFNMKITAFILIAGNRCSSYVVITFRSYMC